LPIKPTADAKQFVFWELMAESLDASNWRVALAQWLVRHRIFLVAIGTILFAISFPASQRLQFDRSITAMFSPDDPTFQDYMLLRTHFGSNTVVMFVYHDPELMSQAGLQRNRQIAAEIESIEGVLGTLSIAQLEDSIRKIQPLGLDRNSPALQQGPEGSIGRRFDQLFAGYTHSDDRQYASIATILSLQGPAESLARLEALADRLSTGLLSSVGDKPVSIMGEPVLINKGFTLVEEDGFRLATLTILLLSVVVAVSLGSLRFVILTAILIGWTVVLTRAIMVWTGIELSLISSILTAIVTVIAVATVLHLGIRFRRLRERGYTTDHAAITSIARLLVPITVACLTDAAGFIALQASNIMPVQQFGTAISIAALVVLGGFLIWTPGLMTFADSELSQSRMSRQFASLQRWSSRGLRHACRRLGMAAIDHRRTCLTIAAVTLLVTIIGWRNAKSETSFLNNFRADNAMVIAYREVEDHFGGAGVWDIVLEAPPQLTTEYLDQVKALEASLQRIDAQGARVNKIMSLAALDEVFEGGTLTRMLPSATRLSFMGAAMPSVFDSFLSEPTEGKRWYRIMLRSREQNESEARNQLIQQVTDAVQSRVTSDAWRSALASGQAEQITNQRAITGYYVLTSQLVTSMIGDQWRSFGMASILVFLCILAYTRSIPMAVAALIANLLPCAFVLASPGLVGERINMGAALIAAVSIGLSIDGSVHFLAAFGRLRQRGHGVRQAAIHGAGSVGVPLLWATLALVIGFAALSTSEFIPIATFGALVSATLGIGTLVNLTLLPVLVCAWTTDS
jgi:predicted RND superfamily exporter protein